MREEGFVSGTDDVRLTMEILVPSAQVRRIIGKGGQNVRELQRVTGSIIKQPEHTAAMHVHTSHVEKITDCIQIGKFSAFP
ncbi:insulin-like growth factor 2 mRNA-binding protein 2 isoform X1 [Culex pipiens pallens]|uniref:insulin-like growth factor 2 mRNA-binding protein 2 isoform X1 n=1 Tax=Culex pipiens pallens TaxID=42434 RepID=UPI0019531E3D|nr:insulin-like growth factor 2 mRNA-binding protein 2 isoform X1 [Culex pipiens pallens]